MNRAMHRTSKKINMTKLIPVFLLFLLLASCAAKSKKSCCTLENCSKKVHCKDSLANNQSTLSLKQEEGDTLVKETQPDETYFLERDGYVKGVVFNSTDILCGYLIRLNEGVVLHPINLNSDFYQNKLKVWVLYKEIKPLQNKCFTGLPVEVLRIKKSN